MLAGFLLAALAAVPQAAPPDAAAWRNAGLEHGRNGRLEEAARAFERACSLEPGGEENCYYYGRALFALGRYQEAVEPLGRALRASSKRERWRVHRAIARNFEWLDRPRDAERQFRDAIRLGRGRASPGEDPRVDFGAFLYRQGRTEEALPPLSEAADAQPPSARAHAELGRVLAHLNRPEEAAAKLETAVRLNPRDWTAHLLLGRVYLLLGRYGEAERAMRTGEQGLRGR